LRSPSRFAAPRSPDSSFASLPHSLPAPNVNTHSFNKFGKCVLCADYGLTSVDGVCTVVA